MTDEMNKELRALIANLAAVVRVQNGNQHADTNALLDHANRMLSTLSIMSAVDQPAALPAPAQPESKDAQRWVACLRQEYDARAKLSTESQKLAVPFEAYKADADKQIDAAIAASIQAKGE